MSFCRITEWFRVTNEKELYTPGLQFRKVSQTQRIPKSGALNKDTLWYNSYNYKFDYIQMIKLTIYCSFKFKSFPFDSHQCDVTFFTIDDYAEQLQMKPSEVGYESKNVKYGQGLIHFPQSRLPFDISLESLKPFNISIDGSEHSSAGMRLHFARNDFGQIFGGYYVPTTIFVLLAHLSYSIDIEVVIKPFIQLNYIFNVGSLFHINFRYPLKMLLEKIFCSNNKVKGHISFGNSKMTF